MCVEDLASAIHINQDLLGECTEFINKVKDITEYYNRDKPNLTDFILIHKNSIRIMKLTTQAPPTVAAQRTTHQNTQKSVINLPNKLLT